MDREEIDEDPQFKLMGRKGLQRISPSVSASASSQTEQQAWKPGAAASSASSETGRRVDMGTLPKQPGSTNKPGSTQNPATQPVVVDIQQIKQPVLPGSSADAAYLNRVIHSLETLRTSIINERRPPPLREKGLR